jgi:aminotransferase
MNELPDKDPMKKWIATHIAALPRSGIRDFFELVSAMDDVISLGVGEPDFVTPWGIREATIYALEKGHTSYTSNLGLLKLRQAACDYVAGNFGVQYNADSECIITVGVSEALDLALRAILNPGDEVVYHEPCYVSYAPSIRMAHAVPVAVQTTEAENFALEPERLREKITDKTKAILLNFPNNPTGANLSFDQKKKIAEIAVECDVVVITDEIYAELTYGQACQSIAAFPGMHERTIFLHGLSKAYAMTGYRIGYACGPNPLIEAMMTIHQYSMLCASIIAQEAGIEAFRNGRAAMETMKEEYFQRRNVVVKRLNEMGLPCTPPQGAFYVFPNITSTGLSSAEFAHRLLMEHKVAVVPGTAFSNNGEGFVRCAYATSMDELEEAMRRIAIFIKK